jgi:hypothetical protein
VGDDDLQLALYCLYELHYRSFDGVDERWEWHPDLLRWRATLEAMLEQALRAEAGDPAATVTDELQALSELPGPSLSRHLLERGERWQFDEFAIHRSAYQLKEADPHTWAIPRLSGRAKSALIDIQMEEYGDGEPGAAHAELFETVLTALDLDHRYGAHLSRLPGSTLACTNIISLFGLHRRLRGALVGHLALFEMTSVVPMGRYAAALRRLGAPEAACRFYDVHVEADDGHQRVALDAMAGGLAADEVELAGDIVFGARAACAVENRFAADVLGAWEQGRSSLRPAAPC